MYSGDVYDTPPQWLRVLFGIAVLIGGSVMIWYLSANGHAIPVIVTSFIVVLTEYFLFTLPKAANLGTVTALFLIYLGMLAMFLPTA